MSRSPNIGAYRASFYPLIAQAALDPQTKIVLALPYAKALEMRRRFYHMRGLLQKGSGSECTILTPFVDQLHIQIKNADGVNPPKGYPAQAEAQFIITHDCIFDAELYNAMQKTQLLPEIPTSSSPQLHIVECIRQIIAPGAAPVASSSTLRPKGAQPSSEPLRPKGADGSEAPAEPSAEPSPPEGLVVKYL